MIRNKTFKTISYILIPLLTVYLCCRGNLYDGNMSVNTNSLNSYVLLNTLSLLMGITYFKNIKRYLGIKYAIINIIILLLATIIPYKENYLIGEIHVLFGYLMVFGCGAISLSLSFKLFLKGLKSANICINILLLGFILSAYMFVSFGHVNSIMEIIYVCLLNTVYFLIEKIC